MKELDLQALRFDCQCPNCKKWWTCDKDDLKSKVVEVKVPTHPGRLGSPTYPSKRTRYYVNCANCQAEIVVDGVHPALKEYITEGIGK
jgi:hypothetical protein